MKRLLETPEAGDPIDRQLASLLAAVPASRTDPIRKQRLRARIGAQLGSGQGSGIRAMRWALVGGVLALGTVAAAMVGPASIRSAFTRNPSAIPAAAPPASRIPSVEIARTEPPDVSVVPSAEPPVPVASAESKPSLHPAGSPGEDPTLVAAAIQALRNQHDPTRAQVLLNQYLRANPHGALAEEALALSIEAADATRDPRAAGLGCKYLSAYPNGRHRSLASRACEKLQPKP